MRRLHPSVILVSLLVGCAAESRDEVLVESESPLVLGPVAGDAVDGTIPSLGVSGRFFEAASEATSESAVHEGVFSNGGDVAGPALAPELSPPDAPWNDLPFADWRAAIAGSSPTTTVPAALEGQLLAASNSLPPDLAKLDQKKLEDLLSPIKSFLPNFKSFAPTRNLVRYAPLRARWLRSQYVRPTIDGVFKIFSPETRYTYADPKALTELRQRGARTYCAAREAASRQAATNVAMGEMVGFSLSIFGKKIDFGVLEPTISIEEPKVFANPLGDGAQAFKIPFLAGTRLTPIRGIGLPSLPEIRSPLVLLGADGEVVNAAEKRKIAVPGPTICTPFFGCRSRGISIVNAHSKEYVTAVHADAAATAAGGVKGDVTTPVYSVGILRVDLTVFGELYFGRVEQKNERLLDGTPGWAPARPRGVTFASPWAGYKYDESPIRFDDPTRYTAPVEPTFVKSTRLTGDTTSAFGPVLANGMLTRALHDDDHVLSSSSGLKLGAKLTGTASVEKGPVKAILTAGGTVAGDISLKHEVRDSLHSLAQSADSSETSFVFPITGLDVSPRTRAEGALEDMFAHIFFDMDLGYFGHVTIDEDLFRFKKLVLAAWDSGRWGEETHLRIGTGSGMGADPMKRPELTMGHWPASASSLSSSAFETIPTGVDACLASPKPVAPPPPACPPRFDGGGPASAEVCIFSGENPYEVADPRWRTSPGLGTAGYWSEVCAAPSAAAAKYFGSWSPAQQTCLADLASYVCAPVSKAQVWQGRYGLARVLRMDDATMMTQLAQVSERCAAAFITTTNPSEANAQAQALVKRLLQFGTCDTSATMLSGTELVSGPTDPTKAPTPTASTKPCAP